MLAEIKAVTIRLNDALGTSAKENERLLAIIAERDAAIVRLQETASRRENEQTGSTGHPVSTPGNDQPGGAVTQEESRAPHDGAAIVAREGGHEG